MASYYNENDPYVAKWLRNLIAEGLIAPGDVDERSIVDVHSSDLDGYAQCHFFAGIGGWSYALRLAEWPDERSVWTGSCPCQPFSSAGRQGGAADERHLWPAFHDLIAECRPPVVFGEQVASTLGCEWLAGVRADLEDVGYAVGATDLPAASVGSPQKRRRLYWVADSQGRRERKDWLQIQGAPGRRRSLGPWDRYYTLPSIGAWRVEPRTQPLAHGIPRYVDLLRAYGNAIVPQLAAEFIAAYRGC